MLYQLINKFEQKFGLNTAAAHCDIPCKIYDPISAQLAALTVIRMLDLIAELDGKDSLTLAEQAQLSRLVVQKEEHAAKVKEEVRVIWGDYIKQPQLDQFPNLYQLSHSIMLQASKCKQHIDKDMGLELLKLVNKFADIFWQSKGVATFTATSPYPPAQPVVYPKLDN